MNAANHIDNVRIYDWLNSQRTQYFNALGALLENKYPFQATITLDFKAELSDKTPVTFETCISAIGNKSITLKQIILQDEQPCVSAVSVYVYFDMALKQTIEIPVELRHVFANELNE